MAEKLTAAEKEKSDEPAVRLEKSVAARPLKRPLSLPISMPLSLDEPCRHAAEKMDHHPNGIMFIKPSMWC